ncbi:hypothetical protein PAXINDRAFT_18653, partial [Paxillus involutus ATCC 200175]
VFKFVRRLVPDPPNVLFSKDVDRLFREWENSDLLVVNGRGIPIKYWDQFYKKTSGVKEDAWPALKGKWANWKYIATERLQHPDTIAFWNRFSDHDGKRFSYQQILDTLSKERDGKATHNAENARLFFGGDLSHPDTKGVFFYLKSGKKFLTTKDPVIARKWLQLLEEDDNISSQWARIQNTVLRQTHIPSL